MDSSEQTGGASLIAASLTVTNRAEYAVSFSAIKFCEDEGVDVVSGVHLILRQMMNRRGRGQCRSPPTNTSQQTAMSVT